MNEQGRTVTAVILAAGLGTRMKSDRVKVLHPLLGRPMIIFPVALAKKSGAEKIVVVVGHQADAVRKSLAGLDLDYALQTEQLGTGHAIQQAVPHLQETTGPVLILCGDVPLIKEETIRELLLHHEENGAAVTLLTTRVDLPAGYGRIVRSPSGNILKIVEEKDASDAERKIDEINTGIYCFDGTFLRTAVDSLTDRNAQQEYYLTDLIEIARMEQRRVGGVVCADPQEVMGINSRDQLAVAGAVLRDRINLRHMREGVTLIDPTRTWIGLDVTIGRDTVIHPDCYLEGKTTVGEGTVIGPNTRIIDTAIGRNVEIRGFCHFIEARVEEGAILGPFAHLRPGAKIGPSAHIGNFVEIKKSVIGEGSKVNHLSYIGDTGMGSGVNIGAGTITCNYDGIFKHTTTIGDQVFVGSDTQFIAPVTIGDRSLIGAGSTITRDVPEDSLALSRVEQKIIRNGAKKIRERLRKKKKAK
ncbi:MAG: UDP-N-acetylglucosamine diphosphorylase/glucosamine-1-phosphate N-acetyltransferase [Deltaproteobacteria bacterium]|nr:UDP-N-acetylglucosamine diphosphorylase/glucosamine-1-phosphate N-acetyltransferase [Deltaproteobacteria bacterium]